MTILQKPLRSGDGHASRRWHRFGRGDQAVRQTEAWEHETFAEEQARWERDDLEYARICEQVRQAKKMGGDASRRADEAKAEWDARVATQRQADDDAQRANHDLKADHTTFAIGANDSPAPGIIPEPARVQYEPRREDRAARRAACPRPRFRGPATRNTVSNEQTTLEVE